MSIGPRGPRSRPRVMGVVNVTPDSFSDGGEWFTAEDAVAHGHELFSAGADLIDIGGESTRPGAQRVDVQEELRRVLPVVSALSPIGPVSIDTMRAEVAAAALDAGATWINDVSGGLADPDMPKVAADRAVPLIAMHWRGHSATMASRAVYDDVVADVTKELGARVEALLSAGVEPDNLLIDPGFGFAKTPEQSWELLRRLDELHVLGQRIVVGTSRKGFLGSVGRTADTARPATERDTVTAITTAWAAFNHACMVRVHNVPAAVDALDAAAALGAGDAEFLR